MITKPIPVESAFFVADTFRFQKKVKKDSVVFETISKKGP